LRNRQNVFGKFIRVQLSTRYCANDEFFHGLNRWFSPAIGSGVEWRGWSPTNIPIPKEGLAFRGFERAVVGLYVDWGASNVHKELPECVDEATRRCDECVIILSITSIIPRKGFPKGTTPRYTCRLEVYTQNRCK
jgi:hypothetical protein